MKAIIIGTPDKGKTYLTTKLAEKTDCKNKVNIGSLRRIIGVHEPHKGYESEVAPENVSLVTSVIDTCLAHYDDVIVEGYGLSPIEAYKLSYRHKCPFVLLCHKDLTALEDFELVRAFNDEDKWTAHRTDDYLKKLFTFYKGVEQKWIEDTLSEQVFSTDKDFTYKIEAAMQYILDKQ